MLLSMFDSLFHVNKSQAELEELYYAQFGREHEDAMSLTELFPSLNATVLDVERNWNAAKSLYWLNHNFHYSYYLSALYVVVIFSIKYYMKDKQPYNLRKTLAAWNLFLAVFSIIGTVRTVPIAFHIIWNHGFYQLFCSVPTKWGLVSNETGLWSFFFILSKVPELLDTVFIVLRKRQLIFLHWYHHISVLVYCWHAYAVQGGTGFTFITMNYTVHAIMYTYYFAKAARIKLVDIMPPIVITALQILQMVGGIIACSFGMHQRMYLGNESCHNDNLNLVLGILMYISYFALFAHFFIARYITGKKTTGADKKKQ